MRIRVVGHEGQPIFPFGNSGPWFHFAQTLEMQALEIAKTPFGSKIDALVANTHSEKAIREANAANVPLKNRILIIWEPQIVDETIYREKTLSNYGTIFAPSPIWANKVGGIPFNWPQNYLNIDLIESKEKRDFNDRAILMQGNKFSARYGELYSLRRIVLLNSTKQKLSVDLCGPNWNSGFIYDLRKWMKSALRSRISILSFRSILGMGFKFKNYIGIANDKFETLNFYDVSIVIENSADYVSEKLFDAILAGNLVVYVGPNLTDFGFNVGIINQCDPNPEDVLAKVAELFKLSNHEKNRIIYLQIGEVKRLRKDWESTRVLGKLAGNIAEILK